MGDREAYCSGSMRKILGDRRTRFLAASSLYATSPVSSMIQDDFINAVMAVSWAGSPADLLEFLNSIEQDMGRIRQAPGGPRVIDLDILLFDDLILETPSLIIPHPELHRRKFAIVPCLEIDAGIIHPVYGKPLASFLADIDPGQTISVRRSTDGQKVPARGAMRKRVNT